MTSEEYNIIVEKHADHLFRFALKSTRNEADARDIVQLSFEKFWKKHQEVDFSKAKSYLFTTAHRTHIDMVRKNKRITVMEELPDNGNRISANRYELRDFLELALGQLSDIQKKVVLLRDYEGYAYKEIATITGISESQVKVYIFRARKKLQQILIRMEKTG